MSINTIVNVKMTISGQLQSSKMWWIKKKLAQMMSIWKDFFSMHYKWFLWWLLLQRKNKLIRWICSSLIVPHLQLSARTPNWNFIWYVNMKQTNKRIQLIMLDNNKHTINRNSFKLLWLSLRYIKFNDTLKLNCI